MPEPVVVSWSSGKDSALTLGALLEDPRVEPVALLTSVTEGYDRVSIHGVRRELLQAQARAVGLPLHEIRLQPMTSNESYDAAFARALGELRSTYDGVRRIAFGDLFLEDVRLYREERLAATGWEGLFPLWGLSTAALARRFVDGGYAARLVCVDTTLLSADFAGRAYDARLLAELPEGVDPCGERGEFHTFASYGPRFGAPVEYKVGQVVMRDERFAYCDLMLPGVGQGGRASEQLR